MVEANPVKPKVIKTRVKSTSGKKKITFKEKHEYETIDQDLARLEEQIGTIELEIGAAATNYDKLQGLLKKKEQLENDLEHKTERWVYLTELLKRSKVSRVYHVLMGLLCLFTFRCKIQI